MLDRRGFLKDSQGRRPAGPDWARSRRRRRRPSPDIATACPLAALRRYNRHRRFLRAGPGMAGEGDADYARLETLARRGQAAIMVTIAPQNRYQLDDVRFSGSFEAGFLACRAGQTRSPVVDRPRIRPAARAWRASAQRSRGSRAAGRSAAPQAASRCSAARVRVVQLTHNRRNLVGDGRAGARQREVEQLRPPAGRGAQCRWIVVDLARCGSQRTIAEGIARIEGTDADQPYRLPRSPTSRATPAMRNCARAGRARRRGRMSWLAFLRTDTQPMAKT